jgi:hypothetical protein
MSISSELLAKVIDRAALARELEAACVAGNTEAVLEIVAVYGTLGGPGDDARVGGAAVAAACDSDNLDLAAHVAEALDVRELPGVAHVLSRAAQRGLGPTTQWIARKFELTAGAIRAIGVLADAAAGGDLDLVKWLIAHYGLGADDVRARSCRALRLACEYGRLDVARWLTRTFRLTTADARAQYNYALRYSCANGHLATAQWLEVQFGLTAHDIRTHNCFALRDACANGHLETAQWLVTSFDLASHVRDENDYALRGACLNDHLPMVQWLVETFEITTPSDLLRTFLRREPAPTAASAWLAAHLRRKSL